MYVRVISIIDFFSEKTKPLVFTRGLGSDGTRITFGFPTALPFANKKSRAVALVLSFLPRFRTGFDLSIKQRTTPKWAWFLECSDGTRITFGFPTALPFANKKSRAVALVLSFLPRFRTGFDLSIKQRTTPKWAWFLECSDGTRIRT